MVNKKTLKNVQNSNSDIDETIIAAILGGAVGAVFGGGAGAILGAIIGGGFMQAEKDKNNMRKKYK